MVCPVPHALPWPYSCPIKMWSLFPRLLNQLCLWASWQMWQKLIQCDFKTKLEKMTHLPPIFSILFLPFPVSLSLSLNQYHFVRGPGYPGRPCVEVLTDSSSWSLSQQPDMWVNEPSQNSRSLPSSHPQLSHLLNETSDTTKNKPPPLCL